MLQLIYLAIWVVVICALPSLNSPSWRLLRSRFILQKLLQSCKWNGSLLLAIGLSKTPMVLQEVTRGQQLVEGSFVIEVLPLWVVWLSNFWVWACCRRAFIEWFYYKGTRLWLKVFFCHLFWTTISLSCSINL